MKIFLDEAACRHKLFPFTQIRHTADIRLGILTLLEKWEKLIGSNVILEKNGQALDFLTISANYLPSLSNYERLLHSKQPGNTEKDLSTEILEYPWQLFQFNEQAILDDYELITRNRISQPVSESNYCTQPDRIFMEKGVTAEHCFINATNGPVYIGKNAVIMEGTMIRGPVAICEGAVVKMGTKIYGATTVGPYCVAGGEIKNSIMMGYSNKAHDGYLGDSVIGEWCNLGAGTSISNVKNTGGPIKYITSSDDSGSIAGNKGGLLMGDYSRTAINTSFNTGSVVGICCNIFGGHIPGKYTADFSWNNERYVFDKAIRDIENWKRMKHCIFSEEEKIKLHEVYLSKK